MNVATCNVFGKFVQFFFCKEICFKKPKKKMFMYVKESILKSNVEKIKPKYVLKIPPKKIIKP